MPEEEEEEEEVRVVGVVAGAKRIGMEVRVWWAQQRRRGRGGAPGGGVHAVRVGLGREGEGRGDECAGGRVGSERWRGGGFDLRE